jgi:hypothetical protein
MSAGDTPAASNAQPHPTLKELIVKRALALASLVTVVVGTPAVSDAATTAKAKPKPTKRVVTWAYTGFHGVTTPVASAGFENPCTVNASACFDLQTLKYEKQVVVDGGAKVAIQYFEDGDYQTVKTFCGSQTIPVSKGTLLSFHMVLDPTCAGVPTQGKVTLTVTGLK